jgi:hypothetical protein
LEHNAARRASVRPCTWSSRRDADAILPMLGFKRFETAAVTIPGIELAEKIKKQHFNLTH